MAGSTPSNDSTKMRDAFFTRIVNQHAGLLYRVAYSVLRNSADAEDAVSDALLKLLRSSAWQTVTNERSFLARTVWRCALDRFGARPPANEGEDAFLRLEDDHQPSPESSAVSADLRAVLNALIDRLPADLRDPLLLSAVEEMNSRQIGEVLDLPEGTVRTRLMRARQQLRAQFDELQQNARGREVAARGPEQ